MCARHCATCLLGRGAARELAARARRAALAVVGPGSVKGHCAGGRSLCFDARPWCDVSAAASNPQPAFAWHVRTRHCADYLSSGGATRELAARARRAALVVIGPGTVKGHCTGGRPPSVGARPWCDVPAAASNPQPVCAWQARARHCAACFSGGGAACKFAARARRAALVATDSGTVKGHCTRDTPLSFVTRPWCDVSAAASNPQPAFAWHVRTRHCAACLSGGGAARELGARARRAALVAVGTRKLNERCTGGRPPSVGARPWCDVLAAASNP